jgi:TusA-related sulfurtransferase
MEENGVLLVVSDKESMLNDIPALSRMIGCQLVKTFSMKGLLLFIIRNKKWTDREDAGQAFAGT